LQAASAFCTDGENAEPYIATAPTEAPELHPFVGGVREGMPQALPDYLADYLDLVSWTGRAVRDDKRGAIAFEKGSAPCDAAGTAPGFSTAA